MAGSPETFLRLTRGDEGSFVVRIIMAFAVMLVASFAVPGTAQANPEGSDDSARITKYAIDYVIGKDGGVDVTERFDMRFSDDDHHGFERYIVTAQGYSKAKDKHRVYPMSEVKVSSPTGAPGGLYRSHDGPFEYLRVGNSDTTLKEGTQTYVLRYHLDAVVNRQEDGTTQFYWNTLGSEWNLPIDSVAVTVKGPGPVSQVACYRGEKGSTTPCASATAGNTAHFSAEGLGDGKDLSVVAAMPTSAFTKTAPRLEDGSDVKAAGANGPLPSAARTTVAYVGAGSILVIPAAVWFVMSRLYRRDGKGERYAGVTPGERPMAGQMPRLTKDPLTTVAVRFEPPRGVTAGLMGTVIDKKADSKDVAGTIVDLAVRGYLTMEEQEPSAANKRDWILRAQQPPEGDNLLPYEGRLLDAVFRGRWSVRLSDLRNTFSKDLAQAKDGMYREVVERGWFKENPRTTRARYFFLAAVLAGVALVTFIIGKALVVAGHLFSLGFFVAAVVVAAYARQMGARTPEGTAVTDQAKGFELYLKTAEAQQFKFEEAEQIFSRYMPYAVVLGLARRWAKVFAQVASSARSQGYSMPMPMWYMPYGGYGDFGLDRLDDLGQGLDNFGEVAAQAFAATPGSSGGSGFGGGGFAGGGGGGGGGGAW